MGYDYDWDERHLVRRPPRWWQELWWRLRYGQRRYGR